MFCSQCGNQLTDDERFCTMCGKARGYDVTLGVSPSAAPGMPPSAAPGMPPSAAPGVPPSAAPDVPPSAAPGMPPNMPNRDIGKQRIVIGAIFAITICAVTMGAFMISHFTKAAKPDRLSGAVVSETIATTASPVEFPVATTVAVETSQIASASEMAAETAAESITIQLLDEQKSDFSAMVSQGDYILSESSVRAYSYDELKALSPEELRLARNEIYARHGRIFAAADLNAYFTSKPWYAPQHSAKEFDAKGDAWFNKFELANRNLIVQMEGSGDLGSGGLGSAEGVDAAVDYKGDYVLKGEEYIHVAKWYIRGDVLYIEGAYSDGVLNPDAETAGDEILFYPIKDYVTIRVDNNTKMISDWEGIDDIYSLKELIDILMREFWNCSLAFTLSGDYAVSYHGHWASS